MRTDALILTCLAAALLGAAQPARAQQGGGIQIVIRGNAEMASTFRVQLETSIKEFLQLLPRSTQRALGLSEAVIGDAPSGIRTLDDAREYWGDEEKVVVVIWGDVAAPSAGSDLLRTLGEVYLGFSNAQRIVRHPGDGYRRVFGQVRRNGGNRRFELYQAIVGYALLLRAWQRGLSETHINAIADQINGIRPSPLTQGSPCHDSIREAVRVARVKAPLQPLGRVAAAPARGLLCAAG